MKEAKTNRSLHKLILIMAAMLLLLLSACKAVPIEEEIAGTYKPSACVSLDGKEFEIEDEVLHMEKDGTGYFILHNNKYEIRWEYKDGKKTGKKLYVETTSKESTSMTCITPLKK